MGLNNMSCSDGGGRTINQFAVVSYLPSPLAQFLDDLRLRLTPGCNPHAHVTVLPPRPLDCATNLSEAIRELGIQSADFKPFEVRLGAIKIFPVSNVIFAELASGTEELHRLHMRLNSGLVEYVCPFPYHPHITVAQDIPVDEVRQTADQAQAAWEEYSGPRSFVVDDMSFVQNVARNLWVDIARIPLG